VNKDDVADGFGIDAKGDTARDRRCANGFQGIGHGRLSFFRLEH
jgi:hypothetical protein